MSVTRLTKDQFIPFLDINKDKTFENSNWTRIDYSTIFELTVNEVEEDIHYICFENPITVVTSNKPELPQEIALYEGNPMYDFMFDQLYNLPIGEDCKVPFILAFGGSEKRAWRGICTISGKTLNTIDGRISFSMKIGGEITKGFYKIVDGKVVFSTQNTPEPTQSCGTIAEISVGEDDTNLPYNTIREIGISPISVLYYMNNKVNASGNVINLIKLKCLKNKETLKTYTSVDWS